MVRFFNQLPTSGPEFPADWAEEFKHELVVSALRRARRVSLALLVIEGVLILSDLYRTQWLSTGIDALLLSRLTVIAFLLSFYFIIGKTWSEQVQLRYFLIVGMALCCWVTAVMAGVSGDLSTFTIGALGVAASCPLPGRFNVYLFTFSGVALTIWLYTHFLQVGPYWASNIIATCVIGVVIEKFTFASALREFQQRKGIERQRERADQLLYNVFPQSVAASLKEGKRSVAMHGEVTILFADLVGFTSLASHLLPSQLLELLEDIFGRFDQLAKQHGVEKIKTIGDAYMAIAGAPVAIDRQVERMADFALAIVQVCQQVSHNTGFELAIRVGIHTGPVVAGVIGSSRLCYDLWGDSVNVAQRIESRGEVNAISVSEPVYFKLREHYLLEDHGLIDLKGKGPTKTYVLRQAR